MSETRGLAGGTRVEDPISARGLTLAELAGASDFYSWRGGAVLAPPVTSVLSLDAAGRLVPVPIQAVTRSGMVPTYLVATLSGRTIAATGPQAFMTPSGFIALADLGPGCEVALQWSGGDIYWDRIAAIEDRGTEEAFRLTVGPNANFVADGFILRA